MAIPMTEQELADTAHKYGHDMLTSILNNEAIDKRDGLWILEDACTQVLGRLAANSPDDLGKVLQHFGTKIRLTCEFLQKAIAEGKTAKYTLRPN